MMKGRTHVEYLPYRNAILIATEFMLTQCLNRAGERTLPFATNF